MSYSERMMKIKEKIRRDAEQVRDNADITESFQKLYKNAEEAMRSSDPDARVTGRVIYTLGADLNEGASLRQYRRFVKEVDEIIGGEAKGSDKTAGECK